MSDAARKRPEKTGTTLRRAGGALLAMAVFLIAGVLAWLALPKPALYDGVAFSTLVTARDGQPLKLTPAADGRYRLFTPLDDIAPAMIDATLKYEDRRFYRHPGVDPLALVRAAWTTYVRRTRVVGGSTITMQLARLRFGMATRTPLGKLYQSIRAVQLERHYDKGAILEAYLNLAPYGGNIEGVGTASRIYFDKPARALGRGEALALAVIPQNPTARFPTTTAGRDALLAARDRLFDAWRQSRTDHDAETLARARLVPTFRPPSALPSRAPHFVRDHVPRSGAPELRTTLDLDAQRLLEARIRDHVALGRGDGIRNAAAMLLDHRSMEVLALVGSAGFFNAEIAGQVNGVRARRSPGSTLKPLLYALAMDAGLIHPMTLLEDAPERYASFTPENFDRGFLGPVLARDALIHSRNVPAVRVLKGVGVERFAALLDRAEVAELRPASHYGLALALGGNEMTMEELVGLYAAMANAGLWRPVVAEAGAGVAAAQPTRLLSPEASFLVLDMLRDVPRPDAQPRSNARRSAVAWKTGTSYGFRDAWSVGVFGRYTLAVWVGNFDGSGNPALVGRMAAGPLFFAIADSLHPDDGGQIAQNTSTLNLRRVEVCAATGDLPGKHCPRTTLSWFIPGVSPIKVSTIHRAVAVDADTGLRSCVADGDTVQRVFEFWPSNLRTVIRRAGIAIRSPPPWSPECGLDETSAVGLAPRIRSPQPALVYHAAPSGVDQANVPLSAVADGDARALYWFVDDRLVATAAPSDEVFWTPRAGRFTVRVVDDLGRADAVAVQVAAAPARTAS